MPKISQKGLKLPASPIRMLMPLANAAKARGIQVYHLNIGQPDIPTPQVAIDAIKNDTRTIIEYTESAGLLSLREGFINYYKQYDIFVDVEDILITMGASEGINFVLASITDPGDQIISIEPYYANYDTFASSLDVTFTTVSSKLEEGFALPDISEFEKRINRHTKAIMICNPGNPTGYAYSRRELEQLRDLVLEYDMFLIADEVYREFIYGDQPHVSVMHFPELKEHAILLDSVSKRYSMCGSRIGAVVSKNHELQHSLLKFAQARLSAPTYEQISAEAAMTLPRSYYEGVKQLYLSRRNTIINRLKQIEGVKTTVPNGAFYCMVELPVDDTDEFAKWMLESFQHNGSTVMVAPGSGFYSNPKSGKKQVRMAYVLDDKKLLEAMDVLEAGLKAYNARKK